MWYCAAVQLAREGKEGGGVRGEDGKGEGRKGKKVREKGKEGGGKSEGEE